MKYINLLSILIIALIALSGLATADTITLRPDGAGASTQCLVFPGGANYAAVDDITPDEASTYVYWNVQGSSRVDLYNIQNTSVNGTINSVRVYGRNWGHSSSAVTYRLFTNSTSYNVGGDGSLSQTWTTVAGTTQNVNPNTGSAWTWQEINDLQIGISLFKGGTATVDSRTTQLYVVIDYDPFVPPAPVNLVATEGLYFVNYTWSAGSGIVTDSYNVSLNNIWTNGSTNTYFNSTTGVNGWHNISVYAFNSTGNGTVGFLSTTSLDGNTQLPPQLFTPADDLTISESFPPISHDVTFTWEDTLDSYKFQLARDDNFTLIVNEQFISNNTTAISLTEDEYHWRVANYNPITEITSNYSQVYNFTLDLISPTITGTAIDGVIFEKTTAGDIAVDEAIVSISNLTWSDQQITGANGYYQFTGLANDTYSIQATKQGYVDSNFELVTTTFNTTITKNILIERRSGAGDQYDFHYVKFILTNFIGTKYEGVDVKVYKGSDVVETFSGETESDGSITFVLNRDQEYRITFIDTSQGIDVSKTLYPVDPEYNVVVFGTDIIPEDRDQDDILFGAYGQSINLTHGYINVSFNDTSGTTTLAQAWIKDTNLTTLYSFSTTNSTADWSQVVDGGNASYIVEFNLDNTILTDTLEISRTIKFSDIVNYDLGFDEGWKYIFLSCTILILIMLLSSKLNAEIMAGVTILAAWFLTFLGWMTAGLTTSQSITVGLMLLFGTILAFGAIIRKGEE